MAVQAIPEGYHTVTPYLITSEAHKVIEFLKKAFNAELAFPPMQRPDGKIVHAEVKIGDSRVMLSDATEQHPAMQCMLHLYVPDVDATYQRAIAAGGISMMEPTDQFYGDRGGSVKDAGGNWWYIATHKEDVAPDELRRRAEDAMKKSQGQDGKAA